MLKLLKKIKNSIMNNFDMETLISIKSSFQSNKFQWIKTNDRAKVGKIVEVRDVVPSRNGRFTAILSDGTQVDTDRVSSDLMMITDDQPPMSMAEIQSINYIPSLSEEVSVSPDIPDEFAKEVKSNITTAKPANLEPPAQPKLISQADTTDLFGMFELEDSEINVPIKVKLPSKALLQMMYVSFKNKEDFLTKLSNYINNNITVDAIKETMKKSLDSDPKKNVLDNE